MQAIEKIRAVSIPRWAQTLLAIAFYTAFAMYLTWPLVEHLSTTIYGAGGDLTGGTAYHRELVEGGHLPFLPGRIDDLAAPDGLQVRWALSLASLPSSFGQYLLTAAFGSIAAIGIYTIIGYAATGVAMFLLIRKYVGNVWIALAAGWAFAFYPFAAINGTGHNDFAQGWPLVIVVWRMVELAERPTARNGIYAGLGALVALWWSPYFILFGGIAFIALALSGLLLAAKNHRLRKALVPYALSAGVILAFLGVLTIATAADDSSSLRTHSIDELYVYAARPHEYVVPDAHQPVFGEDTAKYLAEHIHGSNASESTLYVGISVILLALVGVIAAMRKSFPPRLRRLTFAMVLLVLIAAIVSGPPSTDVLGFNVNLPGYYIYQITSTFRVLSRLVIVVMLGLTVLAAIGAYALTRGRRAPVAAAILIALGTVVAVDLCYRDGNPTNRLHDAPIFTVLKHQPPGIAADYPLVPAIESDYNDIFQQDLHGKPIINGYREGSKEEARALQLSNLSSPETAKKLKLLGVRYVIARNGYNGGLKAPKPGPGLRQIAKDRDVRILVVDPKGPLGDFVAFDSGFYPREPAPHGYGYWTSASSSTLDLWADCELCKGYVTMQLRSFEKPRKVTIRDGGGKIVLTTTATVVPKRVRVPLQFNHRTKIGFDTSPGPQSIAAATGTPDARSVGVFVDRISFRQARR